METDKPTQLGAEFLLFLYYNFAETLSFSEFVSSIQKRDSHSEVVESIGFFDEFVGRAAKTGNYTVYQLKNKIFEAVLAKTEPRSEEVKIEVEHAI